MPEYRIHTMRDAARQQFRWAPHTSGVSFVKPKDYQAGETITAPTPYAAWLALRGTPSALCVGDLLEMPDGDLRIYKYVGFEQARWVVPETKPPEQTSVQPVLRHPSDT